jgi:hypothetical protein
VDIPLATVKISLIVPNNMMETNLILVVYHTTICHNFYVLHTTLHCHYLDLCIYMSKETKIQFKFSYMCNNCTSRFLLFLYFILHVSGKMCDL